MKKIVHLTGLNPLICYAFKLYSSFTKVKYSAFSLVEMLMALLVASLLLAALAPVMTKRLSGETLDIFGASGTSGPSPDVLCYAYNPLNPVVEVPLDDIYTVNFVIASGGGGGGGASKADEEDKVLSVAGDDTISRNTDSNPAIITESLAVDTIDVALVGGGGGGGGAASYGKASYTQKDSTHGGKTTYIARDNCNELGSVLLGGFCVNRYPLTYADWNTANSTCSNYSLSTNGSDKGQWRLPTASEVTNNWKNQHTTLNVVYGVRIWTKDLYKQNCCSNGSPCHTRAVPNSSDKKSWFTNSPCDSDGGDQVQCVLPGGTVIEKDTTIETVVYNSTSFIKTFSASSGGSAAGFSSLKNINAEAYKALQEAIRNNPNGKMTITAGGGGKAGASDSVVKSSVGNTNAKDGEDGKESCMSVLNAGLTVYKVCAKGGFKGIGVTNITNITNTDTLTNASSAQNLNGCYYMYKGITKEFNCSGGLAGVNGTSSYNSMDKESWVPKTEVNENSTKNIYETYVVSNAVSIGAKGFDIQAVTNSPGGTYGGGGDGAGILSSIAADGNISVDTSVNSPKNGAPGFGRITYKNKYEAAAGGGGGGGGILEFKNIYIGKSSICTFTLGSGGKGGNAASIPGGEGEKGYDGDESGISCTPIALDFMLKGGKGGGGGKSATADGKSAQGGAGGEGSVLTSEDLPSGIKENSDKYYISDGKNGEKAIKYPDYSAGGKGGDSGAGSSGGCGALFDSIDKSCSYDENTPVNKEMLLGEGFVDYNKIINPTYKNLIASPVSYGIAGAGGGGGGWHKDAGSGAGGDGMGGYVCVYWTEKKPD